MSKTSVKSLLSVLLLVGIVAAPSAWAQGNQETLVLNVEGMDEERCEDVVGSLLDGVPAILGFTADHEMDKVTIDFIPSEATAEEIAAAIDWCPSFEVTGSDTHSLDMAKVETQAGGCSKPFLGCCASGR